jgi:hypothetical protein
MGLLSFTPIPEGTDINASDVNALFAQLIAEFNGSITAANLAAGSLNAALFTSDLNPETRLADMSVNFIVSGGVLAINTGLIGTFSDIVYYISGKRCTKASISNKTYSVSSDTYVDIDANGTIAYTALPNGTASPALAAGSLRVGKVITSASAITSIVSTGFDSLGNVYSNKNPFGFTQVFFPTLLNGWVNYDTTAFGPTFYTKDKTGMVTINGIIKNGTVTAGTTLFTLPTGFRPAIQLITAGVALDLIHRTDTKTNGDVILGTAGNAGYTGLGNIRFMAV